MIEKTFRWFLSMLRIFLHDKTESKRSLPPVKDWMENSDILNLGRKTELKVKLENYLKGREGEIVRIDAFGNIITNIQHIGKRKYKIKHKNFKKELNFYNTYAEAKEKELFLIEGSYKTLEISIKNGNAAGKIKVKIGNKIIIK